MNKNSINEISKKHNGKTYIFPIGALAENVKTDNEHQFVTKEEKAQINKVKSIEQAFQDGCDLLVSTCTTYDETPASNSPSDIANAIGEIYNKRYNEGYNQGIKDATPSIERKNYSINATNKSSTDTYTIQHTGIAYIALHMFCHEKYDCDTGTSNPGFSITIDNDEIYEERPWKRKAAQNGDTVAIECYTTCEVTEGQVVSLNYYGGYLCNTHLGGSIIVVY